MIIPPKENISNDESLAALLAKDSGGKNPVPCGIVSISDVSNGLTMSILLILALK